MKFHQDCRVMDPESWHAHRWASKSLGANLKIEQYLLAKPCTCGSHNIEWMYSTIRCLDCKRETPMIIGTIDGALSWWNNGN